MKVLDISKLNMNIPKFEDLEYAFIPSEIYVPLYENSEKLKVGKKIKEGDVLSVLDGGNVHSSIPGIITEIRNNTMPNGKNSKVAVVKMDGAFSYVGKKIVKSEWELFSASHIMDMLKAGVANNILFVGTGALLSPTSSMQGESIPCVAHAIAISNGKE